MPSFTFNAGADGLTGGSISWTGDTIKARLVASSVTPNKDDADCSGHTAIGTDQVLASKTRTKDNATDRIIYDAADPIWLAVAVGSTIGWIVIFKDNGGAGIPIFCIDVPDTPTDGGNVTAALGAGGAGYLQQ